MAEPLMAQSVFDRLLRDRIIWLGAEDRDFVEAEHYVGPDRRVRNYGPPAGTDGRRESDLSGELGAAVDENMGQDDIDMLMKPMKVSL